MPSALVAAETNTGAVVSAGGAEPPPPPPPPPPETGAWVVKAAEAMLERLPTASRTIMYIKYELAAARPEMEVVVVPTTAEPDPLAAAVP